MKVIGALYLIWMVITALLGAWLAMNAFCGAFTMHKPVHHPWLVGLLQAGILGVLFLEGLVMHLRLPSRLILALGALLLVGIMLALLSLLV